ncbi:lipid-A-disaccharide synthase-related protein [Deinococcus multiflagellatus]|uniref:Lipid-A-disaccharide synthase-related protein n=1 Tax=Deinococcus multiflagellatus TaxID=1656887 RepID=A0ABW1ZKH8_9DEIO|nr:lipid-A-disaccharide synthase-related protein [Deinococcus multiflagellatus]MBZ9712348.1 lipid-A-disaccharide synthase-related protein [Deinococcus multiflagellatus]
MTTNFRRGNAILIVSNGYAEDLIGAALARELVRAGRGPVLALPLVGEGRAYVGAAEVQGPPLSLPSGGFPFGSVANLRADLRAGLLTVSLRQWAAARRLGTQAGPVIVVGDTYALLVGTLAARAQPVPPGARLALTHLQPLVSVHYARGMSWGAHLRELNALGANLFMPWEVALAQQARRVYTRDQPSAAHLARCGVNAVYRGSFAMDILPPPERDLSPLLDRRPLLALLPGQRGDAAFSLPIMLEAAAALPELQSAVAFAQPLSALPPLPGWTVEAVDDATLWLSRGPVRVLVVRGAFAAVVRRAALALGTAGTAAEQAAGLGVPVIGFPTPGPQYVAGFARRQGRLLGRALTVVAPDAGAVAQAVRHLLTRPRLFAAAARDGQDRMGAPGALAAVAAELDRV